MLSFPAGRDRGTVLVTGATGFVGRHLVKAIQRAAPGPGRLRLLVRDAGRARGLGFDAGSLVVGDLEDSVALAQACDGVGLTIHLAGALKAHSSLELDRVNAHGTHNLVSMLAERAPGCRLVHVSSLAAAGPSLDGIGTDQPPEQCRPVSRYGESKRKAELAVTTADVPVEWIILRPPLVYGDGDLATRLLFAQATSLLTCVPFSPRPLSLIHVLDLVAAIECAAASDVTRQFIPLEGPERLDTDQLMRAIAASCGRRSRLLHMPLVFAHGGAFVADLLGRLLHRSFFFNRDKMREIAASGWVADPEPMQTLLSFTPQIPVQQGLLQTALAEGFHGYGSKAKVR